MEWLGLWTITVCGFLSLDACEYKTIYVDQKLDHFNFNNEDTFKLRVLISDQHWNETNGPIFFYTGNEGKITAFAKNTGFMWDIAEEYKAMLVFAEHRYYGESKPPRNQSMTNKDYYNYLNVEQVLADFAQVIWYLKYQYANASHSPVIGFGGSYGGMLATWMRMKFPHLMQGVIASSAPMMTDYLHGTDCESTNAKVKDVFNMNSKECVRSIQRSWEVINHFNQTDAGRHFLSDIFHLCQRIETKNDLILFKVWIYTAYFYTAMTNYPTAANFLMPLPANPTKEVCKHLTNSSLDSDELMEAIFEAISVYYNYTGDSTCFNTVQFVSEEIEMTAWMFQVCTELTIPTCADGIHDMLEVEYWSFEFFSDACFQLYGVKPVNNTLPMLYGNTNNFQATNIVFSNGELDPWSALGIRGNLSDSVISIWIKDGVHHSDLRSFSPEDPPSVIEARNTEKHYITKWIHEWKQRNHSI